MNRPPLYRLGILLTLLTGMSALAGAALAQSRTVPLVLEVSHRGKASLAGETDLTVELRNSSAVALMLPARPGWDKDGGLELQVTRADGSASTPRKAPLQPDPTRNTRLTVSKRGVALQAGEGMGLYRTMKTSELFGSAGDYYVVVIYRGLPGGEVVSAPLLVSVGP